MYAPVARLVTLCILFAVVNHQNLPIYQMNVESTFSYGDIKEEVYLSEPRVLKLKKSLYGSKKSPKYWNKKFNECLESHSFIKSKADYCLYIMKNIGNNLYLLLFVDDLLLLGDDEQVIEEIKTTLNENFKINDLDGVSNYLGISIVQKKDTIEMSQKGYLENVLQ
ncbi:hypothetical protein JTB14_037672 [Gonioctena quinquepunctata]|nr:hypothetical protein JTB14_037672 [Gonioctena quinquepunctata]